MKHFISLLAVSLGLFVTSLPTAAAPAASNNDADVAVLDQILATVQPGQKLVTMGDMEILVSNLRAWRDELAGVPSPNLAFDGTAPHWTSGNVYYAFDASVTAAHQKAFLDGANEWTAFANVHFIARVAEANYFVISNNPTLGGGQSAVGMTGGKQLLQLGPNAWNHATIVHEVGHTLGLVHEQQRSDRDLYVTILSNNVAAGQLPNFTKLANSANKGTYDFLSVMHYNHNSFSANPATLDTIVPLAAYMQFYSIMGQQFDPVLSLLDRQGVALVYGAGPTVTSVVSNTLDSGPGSLRTALYYAYDHPGTTITFNIPTSDPGYSGGVFTIQPTDLFPSLFNSTILDGSTEPGNLNPNGPSIQLNGALTFSTSVFVDGLRFRGTNSQVRSLVINGFNGNGIFISTTNAVSNTVSGCYIGMNASGTAAATNAYLPVVLSAGARGNTIGGTTAAARNIISGSMYQGITIQDSTTQNNFIKGNYIGLNAAGTAAIPNAWASVNIYGGAHDNTIGGATAGARNVISGNTSQGISIQDASHNNVIQGNYIGLNAAGTAAIPNHSSGIDIFGGPRGTIIGGAAAGAGNVLSGNTAHGVAISGVGTSNSVVQGNYIGLNAAGTAAVANSQVGVVISGSARSNAVVGNVISGNGNQGVYIGEATTTLNVVAGNIVGLNPAGTAAIPNTWSGVELYNTPGNTIGGSAAARNVLSGNLNYGTIISGAGSIGNVVMGNYVGINAAGSAALGNNYAGVALFNGAQATSIRGNVVSGNVNDGIVLANANTSGNVIAGNIVGLNPAATAIISNAWSGVDVSDSPANIVGGPIGNRNIISGNGNFGVLLSNPNAAFNVVQGNSIGVDITSKVSLPNQYPGVAVYSGGQSNQIGGTTAGAANIIANNLSDGIQVSGSTSIANSIRGNSIYNNAGAGIALYSGGNPSTAPSLTSATVGTNTTIVGTLNSTASTLFHLDFYSSAPPSGTAEATTYLGAQDVTTSGAGAASFSVSVGSAVPLGQIIRATATDPAGNTSILSGPATVAGTDNVGDGIPNAWRTAHFGGAGTSTNSSSCATCDPDNDGANNRQEFLAGTDPLNTSSVLKAGKPVISGSNVVISFQSVQGVAYRIERRNNLTTSTWEIVADQILSNNSLMQITDPGAGTMTQRYYRVDVNH